MLRWFGIQEGDEVIVPAYTYCATANVVVHCGAKIVFADVGHDFNIDVSKLEGLITEKTKAIMPVHLTGRMCDMDSIMAIAKKYDLLVIEDAAQAIGSQYKGHISGSISEVGCFSGHPLKNLNAYWGIPSRTQRSSSATLQSLMRPEGGICERPLTPFTASTRPK